MPSTSTDGVTPSGNSASLHGSWYNTDPAAQHWFQYGIGALDSETTHYDLGSLNGSWSDTIGTSFDRTYLYKAKTDWAGGSTLSFLSFAESPTAADPSVSSITAHTAHLSETFDAKVVESTYSCQLQYRKLGDSAWINAGSPATAGGTVAADLSGLTASTTYEVRMSGSRTTTNTVTWASNTVTFTTLTDSATVTTDPASSISDTSATLNGTVTTNGLAVRVRFGWGTSDGGANSASWANLTGYQSFSSGVQAFTAGIASLTALTLYYFRAFVEWPASSYGSSDSGVTRSFTTSANPLVQAAQEDQMHLPQYDGHYGVATDLYFTLNAPAATSSDRLVTTSVGTLFATGDVQVSKDGGAFANAANAVTQVGSTPLYKLTLSATEMQAELIVVMLVDVDGPLFRDLYIIVRTKERLGQTIINATQIGGSAAAVIMQAAAGGYSLDMQDSAGSIGKSRGFLESMSLRIGTLQAGGASQATLDSGASATDSYYNGDILLVVGGTGAGQSRVITAYTGSTKVTTVNASWGTNPDSTSKFVILPGSRVMDLTLAELASVPAAGASAGLKLQFIFQRFAFKVTQTATLQAMYNSSSTQIISRSVSDDGTTQTVQKAS